jgi:hypothetical protein
MRAHERGRTLSHMAALPERRRSAGGSALAILDTGLLVVVGVVVALVALKVVGIIAGTLFFLIKLALLAGAVFVVLRFLTRRR